MANLKCSACILSVLFAFTASQEATTISSVSTTTKAQATTFTPRITSSITSSGSGVTSMSHALSTASTSHANTTVEDISATSKSPIERSSTGPLTISPNSSFSTLNKTSADLHTISFSTVTPLANDSGLTSALVNTNSTIGGQHGTDLARNPGLVAVLCIFFIVLALLLTVAIAKTIGSRKPQFEKLDDVQMNKMNEESPFAHYPPK